MYGQTEMGADGQTVTVCSGYGMCGVDSIQQFFRLDGAVL